MTSNKASSETSRDFSDFNNMFKDIDRDDQTPDDIAFNVLEKVRLEHNQSRLDNAVEWFDEGHYYRIRSWVSETTHRIEK